LDIIEVIKQTLTKDWKGKYGSIEDILKRDNEARKVARDIIKTIKK
jgi:1-deoxy-D-xylulose 5-phosphate reductoisomerase